MLSLVDCRPTWRKHKSVCCKYLLIKQFEDYPTTHYFRIPSYTQSMIAYGILDIVFWGGPV